MKRIAIIITGGNIYVPKGLINACLNRARNLIDIAEYEVDVYNIRYDYTLWSFKKWRSYRHHEDVMFDSIKVRVLSKVEYYSSDWFIRKLLKIYYKFCKNKVSTWDWKWLKEYTHCFRGYDLISTHSDVSAKLGLLIKERYSIPYVVTWHGSDIHTAPFQRESARQMVVQTMENASCNFFVSQALKKVSDMLTLNATKTVLYNGVGKEFYQYDNVERANLYHHFGIPEGSKVVAFAGTLREIKNADLLPDIYNIIRSKYTGPVVFWIIGNGELEPVIKDKIKSYKLNCTLWGFQPNHMMPDFLNCVDVLVLPSKNEGLPLITLEAMACGANVVGTKVGGIPEAIGEEYCVEYYDGFILDFADKVVEVLTRPSEQICKDCFNWHESARKENEVYKRLLTR